jgi:hypothetical protein
MEACELEDRIPKGIDDGEKYHQLHTDAYLGMSVSEYPGNEVNEHHGGAHQDNEQSQNLNQLSCKFHPTPSTTLYPRG